MEPRVILTLIVTGTAVAVAVRYKAQLLEALRNGPWNGNGPSPTGPAIAADPWRKRLATKEKRRL